jgi:hypothetical protein
MSLEKGGTLAHYVVDTVSAFTDGKDVTFDFLAKGSVAIFCTSLLHQTELGRAVANERDINVVPLGEAANVLALMKALIRAPRGEREIEGDRLHRNGNCGGRWRARTSASASTMLPCARSSADVLSGVTFLQAAFQTSTGSSRSASRYSTRNGEFIGSSPGLPRGGGIAERCAGVHPK